jgi:peptidoglycan LD-endopeptidase CwlK
MKFLDPRLVRVLDRAIKVYDFSVVETIRTVAQQRENVLKNVSKTMNSKHLPDSTGYARAVDIAPYPIDWTDNPLSRARFYYLQGVIRQAAFEERVKIRQGCDWDGDDSFKDQTFHDLPHVELDE